MKKRDPKKNNGPGRSRGAVPVILIHPDDNIAVAGMGLEKGTQLAVGEKHFILRENVETGFRIAITDIPSGQPIIQYGEPLGLSIGVQSGQAITPERVEHIEPQYMLPDLFKLRKPFIVEPDPPTFAGIRRPDGSVGTRNWVVVVPTVACSVHEAEQIAAKAGTQIFSREKYPHVDGIVALSHIEGCAFCEASAERSTRVLANYVAHPNVAAAVLVELGCERIHANALLKHLDPNIRSAKPIAVVKVQDSGSEAAIRAGLEHIGDMLPHADKACRSEVPLSELVLGLKCGGSDGLSGITANPALGVASDRLVRFGGAALITEMSEFSGVEITFAQRAINRNLAEQIMTAFRTHKESVIKAGLTFEDNPSPGNKEGGLFNAAVKSYGAIAKCGNAPVYGILQYEEQIARHCGLHLLVCGANDLISTPALVAAGAQVVCFTTGRGTGIGNPIAPVIKIASNTPMFNRLRYDMDVDAGTIAAGQETIEHVGQRIFDEILAVASGKRTAAERHNRHEFALWTIGPMI